MRVKTSAAADVGGEVADDRGTDDGDAAHGGRAGLDGVALGHVLVDGLADAAGARASRSGAWCRAGEATGEAAGDEEGYHAAGSSHGRRQRRRARHRPVVEGRCVRSPTIWSVSWPLPAIDDDVARARPRRPRARWRPRRSGSTATSAPGGHARPDLVDDGQRVLAARVVGGERPPDRRAGPPPRPSPAACVAVAVAAAAEHHDAPGRPAASSRAAPSALLEGAGLVGVVDEHGERLALVDRLEPPGHRRRAGAGPAAIVGRRRCRAAPAAVAAAEGVAHVEAAAERQRRRRSPRQRNGAPVGADDAGRRRRRASSRRSGTGAASRPAAGPTASSRFTTAASAVARA